MIWEERLSEFRDQVAEPKPMPAAVSVAAVTACLGLSLLIKVLRIAKQDGLAERAHLESEKLGGYADEDIEAYKGRKPAQVPLRAAESAIAGLELCHEAASLVMGPTRADLQSAAAMIAAAARSMLLCAEANGQDHFELQNRLVLLESKKF